MINIYFSNFQKKNDIIRKEIEDILQKLTGNKLEQIKTIDLGKIKCKNLRDSIKIIVDLTLVNFIHQKEKEKFDFIESINTNLPKQIKSLIFIEIIKLCIPKEKKTDEEENKDENMEEEDCNIDELERLRDFAFDKIVNDIKDNNDINNIIMIIDCISNKNKENEKENNDEDKKKERKTILDDFLKKLTNINLFTEDEFFANKPNIKITLLYELNKKNIDNDEETVTLLNGIKDKITSGNIMKKKVEEFLKNDDIETRFELIKMVAGNFDPKNEHSKLEEKVKKINQDIDVLKDTKENIFKYFKTHYKNEIKE